MTIEWPRLEQLLNEFARYNLAIWPMQVFAYALGIVALCLAMQQTHYSSRIVAGILSFLWLWIAIVPRWPDPARGFSVVDAYYVPLSALQGVMHLADVFRPRISFGSRRDTYSAAGILLIGYAMVGYPVIAHLLGRGYPQSPPFGLVPCPTMVFTIGLLLLADSRVSKRFLVAPFLWGIIGFFAPFIGLWEDVGLFMAAVVGIPLIIIRDGRRRGQETERVRTTLD
ncbi:MAG TPA: DUF6064 family protein [Sedimentisphaerales bacterium]|jgi:hypothetical protein|nr:DUF6064 family protein [Sedimentisphaerales bacterium]HNU29661.1 DUF6064 family protein [Sedimentisphaerales bacterium]